MVMVASEEAKHELGTRAARPATNIGRASNTIVVTDDFASSRHARISRKGSQWWLEDLESSNGTLLNGVEIDRPSVITNGDVISIGLQNID